MNVVAELMDLSSLTALEVGRVGENLAAYYLEVNGINCSIVDRRGADIWCRHPSGKMFDMEVKSTRKLHYAESLKASRYSFVINKKEANQFMLTCLETNKFRILSRDTVIGRLSGHNLHMKPKEFTEENMVADIHSILEEYA